jgi:lauroyl/myristoyl acyltransferase
MTNTIKNAIENIKTPLKKVALKTSLCTPLNSYRFLFFLFVLTLWSTFRCREKIGNIKRYKKALNNSQSNIVFIFNCFLSDNYDRLFPHLLAENPEKYLQYVCIEGKEYVRQLMEKDTGVILISGHFGPKFRTLLFKKIFGIGVSTFSSADLKKKVCNSSVKLYKINHSFPYYAIGEEKLFQEGLLRNEWINFLNDVPVKKRESNHQTLFGKNIYLSELPFKLSIKYNIPILFVGTTRIKRQYHVSILPIDEFQTQAEGLGKYITLIEKLLCRNPYAGSFIADIHFKKY